MLECLNKRRMVALVSTGGGKSFAIYAIMRYLLEHDMKILVVVPTTQLVEQMFGDFQDYSSEVDWCAEDHVHKIYGGADKDGGKKSVYVCTWQTLQNIVKANPSWFQKFGCVINDETQNAKSTQLTAIMEKCTEAGYRFGFTGSLDNSLTHRTAIQALFGEIKRFTYTRDLIDDGMLSDIKIKALLLDYSDITKKAMNKQDYEMEISFLFAHDKRNKFISNLACSLSGRTLVLYQRVATHGKLIYDLICDKAHEDTKLFFVNKDVSAEDRVAVGASIRENPNVIVVASYGTTSAGVNFPEIDNIILASPTKSVIRVLQSVGRGLRKADGKSHLNLFDIGDILWKNKKNHTYHHFAERLSIYNKEQFPYKIVELKIET